MCEWSIGYESLVQMICEWPAGVRITGTKHVGIKYGARMACEEYVQILPWYTARSWETWTNKTQCTDQTIYPTRNNGGYDLCTIWSVRCVNLFQQLFSRLSACFTVFLLLRLGSKYDSISICQERVWSGPGWTVRSILSHKPSIQYPWGYGFLLIKSSVLLKYEVHRTWVAFSTRFSTYPEL